MIFILIFVEKLSIYAKHDFSLWPRTGSNPADINRFESQTGNISNNLELTTRINIDGKFSQNLKIKF